MNKYSVTLIVGSSVKIEVYANNEEEAEDKAFCSSISSFDIEDVEIQEVENIELIEGDEETPESKVDLEALGQIPIFQT